MLGWVIAKNAGIADKNRMLQFRNNMQMGSTFQNAEEDETGEVMCVVSIDEENEEFNLPVSFIKMDIEGFERYALLGAEKTIKKYLPKMAICIYHSPQDLWDLILLVKNMDLPNIVVDVRHYQQYSFTDTIMYVYEAGDSV